MTGLPIFSMHGIGDAGIGDGAPEKYLQGELVTVVSLGGRVKPDHREVRLNHRHAAIHVQGLAGYVGGLFRGEIKGGSGDIIG